MVGAKPRVANDGHGITAGPEIAHDPTRTPSSLRHIVIAHSSAQVSATRRVAAVQPIDRRSRHPTPRLLKQPIKQNPSGPRP
jgi:hypothetical protein